MNNEAYFLGIALIFIHEMDAIRCKEWRIFPGLSSLEDRTGMVVFIFLHIPLFYWVMVEIQAATDSFRTGFSIFLLIHTILHLLFLLHKKNEFKDWISWTLIIGAGLCGGLELFT